MAYQRGRCKNTELCSVAASNKVVEVPEEASFTCPKCGDALAPAAVSVGKSRKAVLIGVQVVVLAAGGAGVAWRMLGNPGTDAPDTALAAPALAAPAPAPPPAPAPARQTALVTGGSFTASRTPDAQVVPAMATAPAPQPAPQPGKVLLRVTGPEALANNALQRLAAGYLSLIGNTGIAAAPNAARDGVEVSGLQNGQREVIALAPTSSAGSLNALLRGSADIALSSRRITPAEAERLSPLGDMLSPASEQAIAAQGVAAVVNGANRVPSLTIAQLRGIVSGRIRDWSEAGGAPGQIRLHTLDNQNGQADAPEEMLMDEGVSSSAVRVPTEAAIAAAVAADRNAIGFVTPRNVGAARAVPVAEGAAVPALPTDLAVATETYPLTRRFYFYTSTEAAGGFARRFADYVSSPAGQAVVEAAGLVTLNIRAEPAALPDTASDRLRQFVSGAARLSVSFRFQPNSTELDNRSARELERLVAYLRKERIGANRLVLAAFADNSGPPATNQAVSQRRAEAVAAALSRNGLAPGKVAAFGADLPVADNATPDGRERNRRVEVYLAP